jgi:SAM-dependent methyltransferase
MASNTYSPQWFSAFLSRPDASVLATELAFIGRQLPLPRFRNVLDLGCGTGRHTIPLASGGYTMVGLDRDGDALAEVRHDADAPLSLVRADLRAIPVRAATLDAVICMWQSFGHFDDATNRRVLRDVARALRPGGRLLLDIYHRGFFERVASSPVRRIIERPGVRIVEDRWLVGARLRARLGYETEGERGGADEFDWQLYTPEQFTDEAAAAGLDCRLACCWFDEDRPATPVEARVQLVFERVIA